MWFYFHPKHTTTFVGSLFLLVNTSNRPLETICRIDYVLYFQVQRRLDEIGLMLSGHHLWKGKHYRPLVYINPYMKSKTNCYIKMLQFKIVIENLIFHYSKSRLLNISFSFFSISIDAFILMWQPTIEQIMAFQICFAALMGFALLLLCV